MFGYKKLFDLNKKISFPFFFFTIHNIIRTAFPYDNNSFRSDNEVTAALRGHKCNSNRLSKLNLWSLYGGGKQVKVNENRRGLSERTAGNRLLTNVQSYLPCFGDAWEDDYSKVARGLFWRLTKLEAT